MTDTLVRVDAPVSPERVTPLKPSEALRLGRLTRPVRLTNGHEIEGNDAACARGAIFEAIGSTGYRGLGDAIARWPELGQEYFCPTSDCWRTEGVPGAMTANVAHLITHLNDCGRHEWSDDQIVAWLESLGL